ncbi:MAG TPA: PIN domain-containing protein [Terriglobales bacterium]|nr:PIN domain-containing protein [Terriglobales bacterium]
MKATDRPRIYWDSSCFICLLNGASEAERVTICSDVVRHAEAREFDIYTSTWTIVEVIRPKKKHGLVPPFPAWTAKALAAAPEGGGQFKQLWEYFHHNTFAPTQRLTPDQIAMIAAMFEKWDCLQLVNVDQRVAKKSVELSRDFGLKPADAMHAASAILIKAAELQRWDRDFTKVASIIKVTEPAMLSPQKELIPGFKKPVVALPPGPTT